MNKKLVPTTKGGNTAEENKQLFESEVNALQGQQDKDIEESANTQRMDAMLLKVKSAFKIDDTFSVIGFKDKGKSIEISVENADYSCTFIMKDTERHGLSTKE